MPEILAHAGSAPTTRSEPTPRPADGGHALGVDPTTAPPTALAASQLLALQRLAGNQAVNRLLIRAGGPHSPGRGSPTLRAAERVRLPTRTGATTVDEATSVGPTAAVARTNATDAGPAPMTNVQRQDPPAPAAPVTLTMGSITVTTFAELYTASNFFKAQLKTDASEVPVGQPERTKADELVAGVDGWAPVLLGRGTDPLDQAAVNQAKLWYDAFVEARKDLERWKKAKARKDMEAAAADADASKAAVDGIPDSLAELQRGAFLAHKGEILEHLTAILGFALQISSGLLEVHEKAMEMVGWLANETTHADELIEKFGPIAEAAHKVVAAYEGLSSAMTLIHGGEGATEIDKAASKASAGLGLASAAGSLTGVGAGYALAFGALLAVGQAAMKVVGAINREHAHEFNKLFIEEGELDSVDWSAEPGGRAAYDFMVIVMHAGSSGDIPLPIPEAVDELMVESEELMAEGTGEEVPTKGFWFWKHTNPEKVRYWLMHNRQSIWSMLYGSIKPPGG